MTRTTELKIEGMSCSHCSATVARALESVPGVVQASVDLTAGKATVEGEADMDKLVAAVVEEGYRVAQLRS